MNHKMSDIDSIMKIRSSTIRSTYKENKTWWGKGEIISMCVLSSPVEALCVCYYINTYINIPPGILLLTITYTLCVHMYTERRQIFHVLIHSPMIPIVGSGYNYEPKIESVSHMGEKSSSWTDSCCLPLMICISRRMDWKSSQDLNTRTLIWDMDTFDWILIHCTECSLPPRP